MMSHLTTRTIARALTRAASSQTFYTIRFLVDRERMEAAYCAYAYFRWVDDTLDAGGASDFERMAFLDRQKSLLRKCYRGEPIGDATVEENMLIELVQHDAEKNSGLYSYLHNMMKVMEFDAVRRGRWISSAGLNDYTRWLATAVTEALHYFIGHGSCSPHDETRYLAVSGAHITHMLRDTVDDLQTGYYNIPREVLEANQIGPAALHSKAYRAWVQSRVRLARQYFRKGKQYFARVENRRCRMAGYAYIARFEWLLNTIEKEGYLLRPAYSERKDIRTGLRMAWNLFSSVRAQRGIEPIHKPAISQSLRK